MQEGGSVIMSANVSLLTSNQQMSGIISDELADFILKFILKKIIINTFRSFGLVTNIINIFIYWSIGLRDGVTLSLFALSVSDLMVNTVYIPVMASNILGSNTDFKGKLSLQSVVPVISFYSLMFYQISMLITVFLAIQKCCCVAFPFRFAETFAPRRCLLIILIICFIVFLLFIPFAANIRFKEVVFPRTNMTIIRFDNSNYYKNVFLPAFQLFHFASLPLAAECIMVICTIITVLKLKQSARFRASSSSTSTSAMKQKMTPAVGNKSHNDDKIKVKSTALSATDSPIVKDQPDKDEYSIGIDNANLGDAKSTNYRNAQNADNSSSFENISASLGSKPTFLKHAINQRKDGTKNSHSFSSREIRAIKAVNFVVFIFLVCNTPNMVVLFTSLGVEEFSNTGRYSAIHRLLHVSTTALQMLNLSVNLFVYLRFNTRFRQKFLTVFKCK